MTDIKSALPLPLTPRTGALVLYAPPTPPDPGAVVPAQTRPTGLRPSSLDLSPRIASPKAPGSFAKRRATLPQPYKTDAGKCSPSPSPNGPTEQEQRMEVAFVEHALNQEKQKTEWVEALAKQMGDGAKRIAELCT